MNQKASDAEMIVLAALLDMEQATAARIHEQLSRDNDWAYSTVVTFLRRLEAKNLIEHSRQPGERAFIFYPTRQALASRKKALANILDRLFGGNPLPLISSLLEEKRLSKKEIEEIQSMIENHTCEEDRIS